MKWFYCSGIILLYSVLVNCNYQPDCFVKDAYTKEHWFGKKETFSVYVMKKDLVEIKITYSFMEEEEENSFTTLFFSPETKHSYRVETRNREGRDRFALKAIKKENDWVEFEILSVRPYIDLFYNKNHENITINQTSGSVKDLIIKAKYISLCKDERNWKVTPTKPAYIPLGIEKKSGPINLKFYLNNSNDKPIHEIKDWRKYQKMEECSTIRITSNYSYCAQIVKETNIIKIISDDNSDFVTSVTYGTILPNIPSAESMTEPTTNCPSCNEDTSWMVTSITLIVIIGISILALLIWLIKRYGSSARSKFIDCIPSLRDKKSNEGYQSVEMKEINGNQAGGNGIVSNLSGQAEVATRTTNHANGSLSHLTGSSVNSCMDVNAASS